MKSGWAAHATLLVAAGAACGTSSTGSTSAFLSRDAMLDPQTCQGCHPNHYAQWQVSMHAGASDDPVFRAMNARGQRETNGQLGSFCIKCHAPMALAEGATKDGTNLDSVPQKLRGITCFFCHTINQVTGTHDAAVSLSGDLVMRGEITDPVASTAHASAHDDLQDRTRAEGATMCGACHDIVAPPGAHIERTFAEWQASIFSQQPLGDTCSQCHMQQSASKGPVAQVSGETLPARYTYAHDFPGVDVALPGYPGAGADKNAIVEFLQATLQGALCVTQTGGIRVIVDNVDAGHFWPSGAAQDRRAWAEVIATKGGKTIYQSGVVPDGTAVTSIPSTTDPDLWLLRDCMFDGSGKQVDMFWQAASTEGNELPAPVTFMMTDPNFYKTHIVQSFPRALGSGLPQIPDQVTLRIRLQPIGLDVLQDLVSSGDLKDKTILQNMPTWDVVPLLTWTPQAAQMQNLTYVDEDGQPVSCVSPTGFNVGADKYAAVNHMKCSP
ncbi:MAG TPA: multiheme c-type cytochrome [Polyangiaceae bacterium]